MTISLITNSRLRAFARCRRLHHYLYERLVRPRVAARPLAVGTLIHIALEAWWRWFMPIAAGGKKFATPLEAAHAAVSDRIIENRPEDGEVSEFDLAAAEALIAGYDARWFNDAAETWEVLAVEAPFFFEIVNPATGRRSQNYRYAGKIDVLLRRRSDNAFGFMEHKTTTSDLRPEATYWRRLRMDPQVSDYFLGAAAIGIDPRFCVYDVIGKPSLKPLKATPVEKRKYRKKDGQLHADQRERDETSDEFRDRILADIEADPNGYYARAEVVRLEEDLDERRADVWSTVKSLHETKIYGRHARNTDACFDFNRPCSFFDVCSRVASIDDDTIYRTISDPHEEISEQVGVSIDDALRTAAARVEKEHEAA